MNEEKELPEGWVKTELGMIGVWVGGGTPSKAEEQFWTGGTIPWVSPKDMKTLRIRDTEDHLSVNALEETVLKLCPVGTVLIVVRSGILERTLPVAIAQTPVTMNQDMKGICPENSIEPMYTAYYLICSDRDIRSRCSKNGTTVSSIETGMLKSYPIFLPPLREQQRIVSAIEERFTILDAVATALQQNKQKLKLARASVLKHAVEGKLTEKWRAEHPTTDSGSELLERILAERRAKWEAEQLAKGKDPRKLRYEEPNGPDVSELSEGWCWVTIGQVTECLDYKRIPVNKEERSKRHGDVPYYGANGQVGWIDDYIFDEPLVLVVEDETFLGREIPFSYKIVGKSWINNHAHVLRSTPAVLIDYLNYSLTYYPFTPLTQGTTGRRKLTQKALVSAPYALPPLAEQQQIVAEVERRLSVIEQAQVAIEASLKRIERARQSILEMAFSGRLVPQDPNDEPASVLLERIQEERGKRLAEGKLRGKNGGVKAARGKKTKEQEFVPQWQLLRDAQPSKLGDGSLSNAGAHEDGAAEKGEVGPDKVDKEELGDLVQMPLLLWD